MPVIIHCAQCGKPKSIAKSALNRSRYCSVKCQHLGAQKRVESTCEVCGKNISFIPSKPRRFCSKKCNGIGVRKVKRVPDSWVAKTCPTCKKKFEYQPSQHKQKFCSHDCYALSISGKRHKEPLIKTCLDCGAEFSVVPSRRRRRYCDSCDGRVSKLNFVHNGFKSLDCVQQKMGRNWEEQSEAARKRDGYRCAICNCKKKLFGRKLDVHHIKPRRKFLSILSIENDANNLSNLITLCRSCHGKVEHGSVQLTDYLK